MVSVKGTKDNLQIIFECNQRQHVDLCLGRFVFFVSLFFHMFMFSQIHIFIGSCFCWFVFLQVHVCRFVFLQVHVFLGSCFCASCFCSCFPNFWFAFVSFCFKMSLCFHFLHFVLRSTMSPKNTYLSILKRYGWWMVGEVVSKYK